MSPESVGAQREPTIYRVSPGKTVESVAQEFDLTDFRIHTDEFGTTRLYAHGAKPTEKPKPQKTLRQVIDEYIDLKFRERFGL
jgi:hypothetical protein